MTQTQRTQGGRQQYEQVAGKTPKKKQKNNGSDIKCRQKIENPKGIRKKTQLRTHNDQESEEGQEDRGEDELPTGGE